MKKIVGLAAATALATALLCGPALADEESDSPHSFSGTLTLGSDYYWRGFSLTNNDISVQGSLDYEHASGFYAGIWAGNVDGEQEYYDVNIDDYVTDDSNKAEIDFYAGYWAELGPIELDLMVTYYFYPSSPDVGYDPVVDDWVKGGGESDAVEFHIGLTHYFDLPYEPSLSLSYDYTPDYFGEDGAGHHVNALMSVGLPWEMALDLEIGYQDVEGDKQTGTDVSGVSWGLDGEKGFDYTYYRVGLSREFFGVNVDLSYWGNSESDWFEDAEVGYGVPADDVLILTLSYTLEF